MQKTHGAKRPGKEQWTQQQRNQNSFPKLKHLTQTKIKHRISKQWIEKYHKNLKLIFFPSERKNKF